MRPCTVAAAAAVAVAVAAPAGATPRYAARYQQNCNLCHHNPSGGGLRSLYASQFLVPAELAARRAPEADTARIRPDISESVTLGTDIRTLHVWADEERTQNFFQMQGEVYVAFQADDRWSALVDLDATSSFEIFALGHVLPRGGYVKVGRFTPDFGWKLADHNAFVREELGFDQPNNTDAGVEAGIFPGRWAFSAGAYNGNATSTFFDADRNLAVTASARWRFRLGAVGAALGGSVWRNNREPAAGDFGVRTLGGMHGYVQSGRLAWLWEVDASRLEPRGSAPATMLVTSHELSVALARGIDFVATYSFADADVDHKTGARARYGAGFDILATPFVNVQLAANNFQIDPGVQVHGRNHWSTEVQLHLFY